MISWLAQLDLVIRVCDGVGELGILLNVVNVGHMPEILMSVVARRRRLFRRRIDEMFRNPNF